jgi:PAS domain S-box-containing protein
MFDEKTALIEIGALTDNMGIIVKCNPGAEKLTGYTINELLAMNIKEIMP